MKNIFSLLILFILNTVSSQIKITVTSVPENTPKNATIYLASSLNNWNPNDEKFKLTKDENGDFFLVITDFPENLKTIEYKFTQGSWDLAEADKEGKSIENRVIERNYSSQNIENQILTWTLPKEKKHTIFGNVKILDANFEIPQLDTTRKVWIYLPPSYGASKKKYPVIYMEDGQNLFDEATSFSGEWKIDETMESLAKQGRTETIIVGIDNGGSERLNEYSPWKNEKYGGGKGEKYAEFIAETLKPFVDKNYRTLSQAKNTGLIGSSMGGLISFYCGLKYPSSFGKLGIFSPSFWFAEEEAQEFLTENASKLKATKFYFLAGEKESETMVSDVEEMVELLYKNGISMKNIKTKFDEDGTHSENYWAREFPSAFLWLFP